MPWVTDDLVALVQLSLRHAEEAGLSFAEPIAATMSRSQVEQVVLSAALQVKNGDEE